MSSSWSVVGTGIEDMSAEVPKSQWDTPESLDKSLVEASREKIGYILSLSGCTEVDTRTGSLKDIERCADGTQVSDDIFDERFISLLFLEKCTLTDSRIWSRFLLEASSVPAIRVVMASRHGYRVSL